MGGRGVGRMLLEAAEARRARARCRAIRLEVHPTNHAAIARYRKSGYREFARHRRYYEDGGDALRFEKRLVPNPAVVEQAPPYFHQTTEFTCGPACIMMALAWAGSNVQARRPPSSSSFGAKPPPFSPAPGRAAASPTGWRSRSSATGSRRRSMRAAPGPISSTPSSPPTSAGSCELTQAEFQREAEALDIPSHMTPVSESVLMRAFDAGSVAIVLVSGYHMVPRGKPHWIFAFGRDGRHVLMHDPAAFRDDQGMAAAAETYAVPWTAFERVTHLGRERLSAAIVIRKGPS